MIALVESQVPSRAVSRLVPSPDISFRAGYSEQGTNGRFVWQQSKGIRRWDVTTAERKSGVIEIQSNFRDDNNLGDTIAYCTWLRLTDSTVRLDCSQNAQAEHLLVGLLGMLRTGTIRASSTVETIDNRLSNCYSVFRSIESTVVGFCADARSAIPLRIELTAEASDSTSFFIADNVTEATPPVVMPARLSADTVENPIQPISALNLPDELGVDH